MNLMQRLPTLGNKRPITIVGAAVIDGLLTLTPSPGEAVILNCNSKASILAAVP